MIDFFKHETAVVEEGSLIGKGTKVWHHSHIRKNSKIGENCIIGKNVYVDINAKIGNNVKIQNNVSVYDGVVLEDDVFVGPSAVFTNDLYPRASSWEANAKRESTLVKVGASIGANATIICGNRIIGKYALVGAGAVVTKDVPNYALVVGNPAKVKGFVCVCARKLDMREKLENHILLFCPVCNKEFKIPVSDYSKLI